MRFTWDHNVPLRWFEVFVNTIEGLLGYCHFDWDGLLANTPTTSTSPFFRSRMTIRPLHDELRVKYTISALYKTGFAMATTQRSKLYAGIVVNNRPIGFILYELKPPRLEDGAFNGTDLLSGNDNAIQTLSTTLSKKSSSTSSALSARRSGTAKLPRDHRFEVYYEFEGTPVPQAAIFAAFVEAIATAAQHDDDLPGGELFARSPDHVGSVVMRRDARIATFTWGDVKNALDVLWRQIIINYANPEEAAWEDMAFLISYNGGAIGEGFVGRNRL